MFWNGKTCSFLQFQRGRVEQSNFKSSELEALFANFLLIDISLLLSKYFSIVAFFVANSWNWKWIAHQRHFFEAEEDEEPAERVEGRRDRTAPGGSPTAINFPCVNMWHLEVPILCLVTQRLYKLEMFSFVWSRFAIGWRSMHNLMMLQSFFVSRWTTVFFRKVYVDPDFDKMSLCWNIVANCMLKTSHFLAGLRLKQ